MCRWSIFVLGIAFLFPAGASASQPEIELVGPPEAELPPNDFSTIVFSLTNKSKQKDTFLFSIEAPEGWSVISELSPLTLLPDQTERIFITIYIPLTALSDIRYELSLEVRSRSYPEVSKKAIAIIKIIPVAGVEVKIPAQDTYKKVRQGQRVSYSFRVKNKGNFKDRFQITVFSARGWTVTSSEQIVELDPGKTKNVLVSLNVPKDASIGTKEWLSFTTTSLTQKEVYAKSKVLIEVIIGIPKRETMYKKVPAKLILHLSGLGTGTTLAPQAEFYMKGDLLEGYWFDYRFKGPYFKDRENYKTVGKEEYRFRTGQESWSVGVGDITTRFTNLTLLQRAGRGLALSTTGEHFDTNLTHSTRKMYSDYKEYFYAADFTTKLNNTDIKFTHINSQSDWSRGGGNPMPEDKRIFSLLTTHRPFKPLELSLEYARSLYTHGTTEKKENKDRAWQFLSKFDTRRFYSELEYTRAGSFFPGARRDAETHRLYSRYYPFDCLSLWTGIRRNEDNVNEDDSLPTNTVYTGSVGSNLRLKNIATISSIFDFTKEKSKGPAPFTDKKKRSITIRVHRSFGPFSISVGGRYGYNNDYISSHLYKVRDYNARLSIHKGNLTGWIFFDRKKEEDPDRGELNKDILKQVGVRYHIPRLKLDTSFSYTQQRRKSSTSPVRNSLTSKVTYKPNPDFKVSFELEKRDTNIGEIIGGRTMGRWRAWISVTKKFDVLLPWFKVKSTLKGKVFLDLNNNGIQDKGEERLSDVILIADGNQAITEENGQYIWVLSPGEYSLDLDRSSFDIGLTPTIPIPYKLSLSKGQTLILDIPLAKTARMIKGIVFEDKNRTAKFDEDDSIMGGIRIELISDTLSLVTLSDDQGRFFFANVPVGRYKVRIDKTYIPEGWVVTTQEEYDIDIEPGEEISNLDFGLIEKERPIIKTFSAPSVETIYPEEN